MRIKGKWYFEKLTENEGHLHRYKKVISRVKTQFQLIEIIDTLDYGRVLFLDNIVQSTELDEFIYHEALVHPALTLHSAPEVIFIAGGGEGAPLREILKHPSIKEVTMVEIDLEVVKQAKKYLKKWHRGAFNSPKVKLFYEDARGFLQREKSLYDCIILDLCDPQVSGPSQKLFTSEFYELVRGRLLKNGICVIQGGSANLNMSKEFSSVYKTLKEIFPEVLPYQANIPSFVGPWAFFLAGMEKIENYSNEKHIKLRIKERKLKDKLKYYSSEIHTSLFSLPPYFKNLLQKGVLITDKNSNL